MQGRILDFSLSPVKLRVRDRQLKIWNDDQLCDSIPIEDVAVVVLSHPQISLSLAVMQTFLDEGVTVVFCDSRSIPSGLCFPIDAHHRSAERIRMQAQAQADRVLMKRLWKQIVRHKIKNQSSVLLKLFQTDEGLIEYYKNVKSGDADNRESAAAKKYWARLFSGMNFRRDYDGNDMINAALNYGYSLLRAIVSRAIVAAGLCPSLGIFHHNQYNAFALADDLIEPFRPIVDYCVYGLLCEGELEKELSSKVKTKLIRQIAGRYLVEGLQETIFEAATKEVESLVRIFKEEAKEIVLPTQLPLEPVDAKNAPVKKTTFNSAKTQKQTRKKPEEPSSDRQVD